MDDPTRPKTIADWMMVILMYTIIIGFSLPGIVFNWLTGKYRDGQKS